MCAGVGGVGRTIDGGRTVFAAASAVACTAACAQRARACGCGVRRRRPREAASACLLLAPCTILCMRARGCALFMCVRLRVCLFDVWQTNCKLFGGGGEIEMLSSNSHRRLECVVYRVPCAVRTSYVCRVPCLCLSRVSRRACFAFSFACLAALFDLDSCFVRLFVVVVVVAVDRLCVACGGSCACRLVCLCLVLVAIYR